MGSFKIEWKASASRELKRLDQSVLPRIYEAVRFLATNPYPQGCRKLQGCDSVYRIRVGDYRVLYEVVEQRLIIEIVRVRHRKDVYR
jgi:mRNA interferase RelE/StbE